LTIDRQFYNILSVRLRIGNNRRELVMKLEQVTKNTLKNLLSSPGIVIIDCWAEWCGGCKDFDPVFEKVAARHPNHTFARLDTQAEESLVEELGIKHIPSLLVFRDGIMLYKQPGNFKEDVLADIVSQAESLDMEQVRAEIAATP
jgi:thioredoxin 1